jgi:hypothetical protein
LLRKYTNKITLYPTLSPAGSPLSLEILSETRHRKDGRKQILIYTETGTSIKSKFERVSHLTLQRYAEAGCKVSYIPRPYPTYGPKYIVGPES